MNVERRKITSRAEWLEWRKPLLTASDIGTAAGVNPYMTALELHLEKAGMRPHQGETPLMRRGRLLEGSAVAYLQEEMPGWKILDPKVFLIDHEHRLGATPDRLLEDPDQPDQLINCQIKVVSKRTFNTWDGEPPLAYMLQVGCENLLLDAASGILAVLVISEFDAHLETFPVPRHPEAEAKILAIADIFWDCIARGELPPADYGRDQQLVREIYLPDPAVPAPVDLTGDNRIIELLDMRDAHKAAVRAAEEQLDSIDAEIVAKLNGAMRATAPGWKITHGMVHRKEFVMPAKSYPQLRITRTKDAA